jgi:hypothetical protein
MLLAYKICSEAKPDLVKAFDRLGQNNGHTELAPLTSRVLLVVY